MNTSLFVLSIKNVRSNFKEMVKLSTWINKYFITDRYTDDKFIKSLKKKDIVICECLADMVVHNIDIIKNLYHNDSTRCYFTKKDLIPDIAKIFYKLKKNYKYNIESDSYYNYGRHKPFQYDHGTLLLNIYLNCKDNREEFLKFIRNLDLKELRLLEYYLSCNYKNDMDVIKLLIEKGVSITNFMNYYGVNEGDKFEILQYALNNGYCNDSQKITIFKHCCREDKNIDNLKLIMDYDFNISSMFDKDKLSKLVTNNNLNILDFLVENGADIKSCSHLIIQDSCRRGHCRFLTLFYSKYNIDFNYNRETVVESINKYSLEVFKALHICGFNFSFPDDRVLKYCIQYNKIDIFNFLIHITEINNIDTIKLILDYSRVKMMNILINERKTLGSEILLKCVEAGKLRLVCMLLQRDVRHPDAYHTAMKLGYTDIAKLIRKYEILK